MIVLNDYALSVGCGDCDIPSCLFGICAIFCDVNMLPLMLLACPLKVCTVRMLCQAGVMYLHRWSPYVWFIVAVSSLQVKQGVLSLVLQER